jgi:hypothetical protein
MVLQPTNKPEIVSYRLSIHPDAGESWTFDINDRGAALFLSEWLAGREHIDFVTVREIVPAEAYLLNNVLNNVQNPGGT